MLHSITKTLANLVNNPLCGLSCIGNCALLLCSAGSHAAEEFQQIGSVLM